jgi:hypothetical protein
MVIKSQHLAVLCFSYSQAWDNIIVEVKIEFVVIAEMSSLEPAISHKICVSIKDYIIVFYFLSSIA